MPTSAAGRGGRRFGSFSSWLFPGRDHRDLIIYASAMPIAGCCARCQVAMSRGRAMSLVRRQVLQLLGVSPAVLAAPRRAKAQAYPSRAVRVIVTTGPGGQGDTTARLVAAKLTEVLGQSFYVENMPGAGGNI